MARQTVTNALNELTEAELASLSRIADHYLSYHPLLAMGHRPDRLRPGQGFEFLDHRQYSIGDDLRNIDWRVTARSRQPQIRRYRDELTSEWYICLDRSASMTLVDGEKWSIATQLAAAFAYLLLHLGNRVGLLLFSNDVDRIYPPGRSHHQYSRLIKILNDTSPSTDGQHSALAHIATKLKRRVPVVVISDFLMDGGMLSGLERLVKQDRQIHAIQVLSEQEINSGVSGLHRLQDIETLQTLTMNITDNNIRQATAQLQRVQDRLSTYCKQSGISLSQCNSNQKWKSIILQHLKGLAPQHV